MSEFHKTDDFVMTMIPLFAEVAADDHVTESIRNLRLEALRSILYQLHHYKKQGYDRQLLCTIAEKKGALAMGITTKAELQQLQKPRCPHFDGVKFHPNAYTVLEEELICWSETSLLGPLNEHGYQRYAEIFRQLFPEMSRKLAI